LTVTRYVESVRHWHEHKHASVLVIGQLRHQSATAPSLATHAADAVAAHQYHECDNYGWRLGVVASVVRRMNEVTIHRARLVLGWVTVFGRVYHHGM